MLRAGEKGRWNATSAGAGPIGEESPRTRGRATGQVPTGHSEDRRPCAHAAGQRHSVQRDRENGLAEQARRGPELCREPWGEATAAGKDARGAGPRRRARGWGTGPDGEARLRP